METANPGASEEAKKLLNWLAALPERPDKRVISGQHIGGLWDFPAKYDQFVGSMHTETGQWIALVGVDYAWGEWEQPGQNSKLKEHWNDGGLVVVSWHQYNPWTGDGTTWTGGYWWDTEIGDLSDLWIPGNEAYQRWHADLDMKAQWLADLRDAGVVILFRPFHEMGDREFAWWSWRDPGKFVNLWQYVFNYLTVVKDLSNLLWVYSPSRYWGTNKPAMEYWPGDGYVDIVGLDYYLESHATLEKIESEGYTELVATGKPFALTEFGPTGWSCGEADPDITPPVDCYDYARLISDIKAYCPRVTYVMPWNAEWAIVNQLNAQELLDDPWVITRDEIDWRKEEAGMTLAEELEALKAALASLNVDVAALIAHIDNALAKLAEFEEAKEAALGIE